jgi:hypothetical protein
MKRIPTLALGIALHAAAADLYPPEGNRIPDRGIPD